MGPNPGGGGGQISQPGGWEQWMPMLAIMATQGFNPQSGIARMGQVAAPFASFMAQQALTADDRQRQRQLEEEQLGVWREKNRLAPTLSALDTGLKAGAYRMVAEGTPGAKPWSLGGGNAVYTLPSLTGADVLPTFQGALSPENYERLKGQAPGLPPNQLAALADTLYKQQESARQQSERQQGIGGILTAGTGAGNIKSMRPVEAGQFEPSYYVPPENFEVAGNLARIGSDPGQLLGKLIEQRQTAKDTEAFYKQYPQDLPGPPPAGGPVAGSGVVPGTRTSEKFEFTPGKPPTRTVVTGTEEQHPSIVAHERSAPAVKAWAQGLLNNPREYESTVKFLVPGQRINAKALVVSAAQTGNDADRINFMTLTNPRPPDTSEAKAQAHLLRVGSQLNGLQGREQVLVESVRNAPQHEGVVPNKDGDGFTVKTPNPERVNAIRALEQNYRAQADLLAQMEGEQSSIDEIFMTIGRMKGWTQGQLKNEIVKFDKRHKRKSVFPDEKEGQTPAPSAVPPAASKVIPQTPPALTPTQIERKARNRAKAEEQDIEIAKTRKAIKDWLLPPSMEPGPYDPYRFGPNR